MLPHHNDRAIWFVIFVFLAFLVGNFIFVQYEILQIKNILSQPTTRPTTIPAQGLINQAPTPVARPTPIESGPTPTPKVVVVYSSPAAKANQITYVPISGGSTQNTDWAEVAGTAFSLSIGDYGAKAYSTWDANLRVNNANGTTYARIFDKTHGIAVNGSEISITNTSVSADVISGQLSFWQGNNSYVIQLKSLNGSTAFMDSGRIKINY